jgi:ribosomal protein S21
LLKFKKIKKKEEDKMAKKGLVKVEIKDLPPNASCYEREKAFKTMLSIFKRQVNELGIISEYKERQFYESPSVKRKRKRKEAEIERQKEKIRSHF